ncbi:HotDog domain-containing protein [Dichotomocladium elegans]|nr:HotDog domain-containing protein [Dichotomocladium elegans]
MRINPAVSTRYPDLSAGLEKVFPILPPGDMPWDSSIAESLMVVDAAPNKIVWEFKIAKVHCNLLGGIHGGCIATLIDTCSSCALLMYDGKYKWKGLGVTTDLSVSYMRSMRAGQTARIECVVQRCGKNIANIYTEVMDETGAICYAGSHTKFSVDSRL